MNNTNEIAYFDESIKSNINDLNEIILTLSTNFENSLESMINSFDSLTNIVEDFNSQLDGTLDNQENITLAVSVFSAAMDIVAINVALATTQIDKFNLSLLKNPIIIAIEVIGLLVIAFAGLSAATQNQTKDNDSLAESARRAAEEHQKLIDSAKESAESAVAEMDYYQQLKNELDTLVDSNGKVSDSNKERVKFILGMLSEATGKEIRLTNDTIDGYKGLSSEIDTLIDKKRAEAVLSAHDEEYINAIEHRMKSLRQLSESETKLNDLMNNKNAIIKESADNMKGYGASEETRMKVATSLWKKSVSAVKDDIKEQEATFEKYDATVTNCNQAYTDYFNGNYKDLEKTINGTNELYIQDSNNRKKQLDDDIKHELSTISMLNQNKKRLTKEQYQSDKAEAEANYLEKQKHLSEVNEMILQETPAYKNAMEELSKAGIVAYDESGNLTEAAKKKFDELGITVEDSKGQYVSALSELVNEGQSIFDENGNLSIPAQKKLVEVFNGIEEVNPLYGEALTKMVNDGQLVFDENGNLTELAQKKLLDTLLSMEEIDPLYSEALNQMANEGQAIFDLNGELTTAAQKKMLDAFSKMNEDKPKYTEVLTQMANEGQQVFDSNGNLTIPAQKKLIDAYASINNLSPGYKQKLYDMVNEGKDAFDSNGDLTEGAKSKINGAKKGVDDSKYNFKNSMLSASQEGFAEFCKADTFSAGVSFIAGAAQGANANSSSFINTIASIALWGLSTISKLWDINSPSKKTKKLAASFMEGLDIGIEKNKSGFFDQISTMGEDAISELESSFQSINVNALGNRMRMAIENENLHMRGIVNSNFTSELFSSGRLKVELPKISGTIHGSIENHILMDGRETAVQLTPFISEELAFSSK